MATSEVTFRWATVTSTSPLAIKMDGDSAALGLIPDSLIDPLTLSPGDRVRVEMSLRKVVVHGVANGVSRLISPRISSDVPSTYPDGVSVFSVSSAGSFFPYAYGTVTTVYDSIHRAFQVMVEKTTGQMVTRAADNDVWQPWTSNTLPSRLGGDPFNPGAAQLVENGNVNDLVYTGFYRTNNMANGVNSGWWFIEVIRHNDTYIYQRATSLTSSTTPTLNRWKLNGTWSSWSYLNVFNRASGSVAISLSGSGPYTGSANVTFPAGRFSGTPSPSFAAHSGSPQSEHDITFVPNGTVGMTINYARGTNFTTSIYWSAIYAP